MPRRRRSVAFQVDGEHRFRREALREPALHRVVEPAFVPKWWKSLTHPHRARGTHRSARESLAGEELLRRVEIARGPSHRQGGLSSWRAISQLLAWLIDVAPVADIRLTQSIVKGQGFRRQFFLSGVAGGQLWSLGILIGAMSWSWVAPGGGWSAGEEGQLLSQRKRRSGS